MKAVNLKFFGFIIALVFSTSALQANHIAKVDGIDYEALRNKVVNLVQNPGLASHGITETTAKVEFILNDKHEVEVRNIDTKDSYIKSFIKERLSNQKIDLTNIKTNTVYTIEMTFRLG
jgi:hypothetical protein